MFGETVSAFEVGSKGGAWNPGIRWNPNGLAALVKSIMSNDLGAHEVRPFFILHFSLCNSCLSIGVRLSGRSPRPWI